MFSNERIILKPGLYGIMLSYSIQVYQAIHEEWLRCFDSLAIPLTIMKIVSAGVHQVHGFTGVRKFTREMKGYGEGFSTPRHFETAILPCAMRPRV